MRWAFTGFPSVTLAVCVILTKPDIGHLVRPRSIMERLWPTPAIIIDKRGIEVLVLLPDSRRIWVRRDALQVLA